MKFLAILTAIVLFVAVCGAVLFYMTAGVTVNAVGMTATEAAAQQATFDALQADLAQDSLVGTLFQSGASLGDAAEYQFFTYTVRLENHCMLPCDMVELQVTPREGDVLQMGATASLALAPRSVGDVSATVLTTLESTPVRELIVTYYLWGVPFTVKTTYGG